MAAGYQNMEESSRRRILKAAAMVALTIFLIVIILGALAFAFFSCFEASFRTPTEYFYEVSIRDLNGARTEGGVEILLPVPCINGKPAFSDVELTGSYNNWQSTVITTDSGRMISLRNGNVLLNDVDITFYNRTFTEFFPTAAADLYFSPRMEMENQSMDDTRRELGKIWKNSEHSGYYHASDTQINYRLNMTLKKDRFYEGYTTVMIKGSMAMPRSRAISVDLDFHVRGYGIVSYTVINDTGNITIYPVAISGV
jgi:hypothetical protein